MHCRLPAAIALVLCTGAASAANVALGGPVSTSGGPDFFTSPGWGAGAPAPLSSVTDGAFLPNNTQWNLGTVFWTGPYGADTVFVTLSQTSVVSSITLQADNNDDYGIAYRDTGGTWHDLVTISPNRSWGLDMGNASFAPITATAFAITSVGGDGYNSVSEFQAIGQPVPEPETYALMLAGLGIVGAVARRRSQR
jgi:hypothetical protein